MIPISIRATGHATYPPGSRLAERTIPDFELVWIESGTAVFHHPEGDITLEPGSILWVFPNERHAFTWDPNRDTMHGFIHFDIPDANTQKPAPTQWPRYIPSSQHHKLIELCRHAMHCHSRQDLFHQHGVDLFSHIVTLLAHQAWPDAAHGHELPEPVEQCLLRLFQFWHRFGTMRDCDVEQLATWADCSKGHLIRLFRHSVGISPKQFITQLRLHRALSLLERSDLSVQAIAEQCGFNCPFHFSRLCKKQLKQSPRSLRQDMKLGAIVILPHADLINHVHLLVKRMST